ncbi:PREDICTED: EGF domain-specific O-linked N-acetylglucosamine transferase-like [Priapulus caudatus]|uniref:EGF domain-specific O-linked N-acetylglucosamine transferase n=1 Tax=Priapulus caudatus TaxID=37621 RepID=A0ABM1EID4_PRICU|nr:PREDICTED: EGF domain-specific O-linked N-acetylglucosamine transferase-like [Priapulus caudatus]
MVLLLLLVIAVSVGQANMIYDVNLPAELMPYWFHTNPKAAEACKQDEQCAYAELLKTSNASVCWGYEDDCTEDHQYSHPKCDGQFISKGSSIHNKVDQVSTFYKTADFGYVKKKMESLTVVCQPEHEGDSILTCAEHTRYCRATNIYFDLTKLNSKSRKTRYQENIFAKGDVGGRCKLKKNVLRNMGSHKSPLQSWYAELEMYTSLDYLPIQDGRCDIVIDKPTFIVKLDAGVSLYHHFCDFINLYQSMHMNNSFSTDVTIVMWDTSSWDYADFFVDTWRAFTDYNIVHLRQLDGKKVCFKDVVFPLLARMRYGLYYNMPLVHGCNGSGVFHSFNRFLLHRLEIKRNIPIPGKVRVTVLQRNTRYRNVLNQVALVEALERDAQLLVTLVEYNTSVPFLDQMQQSQMSDVFIGMHGSGLAHLLFQPDWGVLFELYNCGDSYCYSDLSNLRGVKYMTWEDESKVTQQDKGHHPTLGAHQKFTNYEFDVDEFVRMVNKAKLYVLSHPTYVAAVATAQPPTTHGEREQTTADVDNKDEL